jgi:hypothetical protein
MKNVIPTILIIACISLFISAAAEPARQISWDDLIPAHLRSDGLLADLDQDQRDMVFWVINMLENLPERGSETEAFYQEIDDTMPSLKKAGIDIAAVMAKRKEIQTAVVEELDGKDVRMPGYLLPLEVNQDKVTEFLLVPYVGACIHVPPPPPNQIVHVKVLKKDGYRNNALFDPVWVTGTIHIKSINKELYLVDGSAGIDIGYSMQASQIAPYE